MKISMFAVRTSDIAEVGVGDGKGVVIKIKDSEILHPVYRVDADLPETWTGRVAENSPYLNEAMAKLREAVVKQIGVSDGTAGIERGRMLKELLLAVENKTDAELSFAVKLLSTVHQVEGGLVAAYADPVLPLSVKK